MTDQQLDTMITDEHINAVSLFLPKWEQVANQLGVDQIQIDGITQEPGIDNVTQNHRALAAWKNAEHTIHWLHTGGWLRYLKNLKKWEVHTKCVN